MQIYEAIEIVISEISGYGDELHYFNQHIDRYKIMCEKFSNNSYSQSLVLDIGSHFLHQSMLISLLGYKVIAIDVSYFADIEKIKERAIKYKIELFSINSLEKGFENKIPLSTIDIILFTEILEHITFNPSIFWLDVKNVLKTNGLIYISTPNSMRLLNIISTFKNLVLFRSIGLDYKSILNSITYGHHWKEYSPREIRKYFQICLPNFSVNIEYYYYRKLSGLKGIKNIFRTLIIKLGRFLKFFSDEMQIILRKKN
jgi:2-polyprenyl-6-hydroxyphenyl methylase/3-demethylubiquinone-9 3-methyltransferase